MKNEKSRNELTFGVYVNEMKETYYYDLLKSQNVSHDYARNSNLAIFNNMLKYIIDEIEKTKIAN